jgi:hypothetical protein
MRGMGLLSICERRDGCQTKLEALGASSPMRLIIEERGPDLTLTADEQLVYDALIRERRLPGGVVRLVDDPSSAHTS